MAGQREQKFNTGYGANTPDSLQSAGATVKTQTFEATAARTESNAQGLAAIGAAMGGFFNTAAKSAEAVGDVIHREELVQIDRENKALEWQATADQKTGKEADQMFKDRQAYAGTYVNAAADEQAFKLSEGLRAHMAQMPLADDKGNPTDPAQYAKDFYISQVGAGTGDPQFDARSLATFSKDADSQVSKANDEVRKVHEQQVLSTVVNQMDADMRRAEGMTPGKLAVNYASLMTLARGNAVAAKRWFVGALSDAMVNNGQAVGTLNALHVMQVGADEAGNPISWSDANPNEYKDLSEKALKQTTRFKTVESMMEFNRFQDEVQKSVSDHKGHPPMNVVLGHMLKAKDLDSRWGIGRDKFAFLNNLFVQRAEKEAKVNTVAAALSGGINGIRDAGAIAAATGQSQSSTMREHFAAGVATFATQNSRAYPDLAASAQATNGTSVDFLSTDRAPNEMARLVGSASAQQNLPAPLDELGKSQVSNALLGPDIVQARRAYSFLRELDNLAPNRIGEAMESAEVSSTYQAIKRFTAGGGKFDEAYKRFAADPTEKEAINKEAKGEVNWRKLLQKDDVKPATVEADIRKGLVETFRDPTGRNPLGRDPKLFLGPKETDELGALVAIDLRVQARGGVPDLQRAIKNASAHYMQKMSVLPGMGSNQMQLVEDPYNGKGRAMGDPINSEANHPYSVQKGNPPMYATKPFKNAFGSEEDPMSTYKEDVKGFAKALPSLMKGDTDRVWLQKPSDFPGMHRVMLDTNVPLYVVPGGEVKLGDKAVKLPTKEADLAAWSKTNMPAGFYLVPSSQYGAGAAAAYEVHYAFRMKGNEAARTEKLRDDAGKQQDIVEQNDRIPVQQLITPKYFAKP